MRQSRARGTWAGAVILAVGISAALPCVSAGSTELARPYLLDGPELADGRVFFMTSWREDGYALQVAGPGARVRTVATGREAGPANYRHYSFDVAPGRIGLQASRISHEGDSGLSDPSAGVTWSTTTAGCSSARLLTHWSRRQAAVASESRSPMAWKAALWRSSTTVLGATSTPPSAPGTCAHGRRVHRKQPHRH
jgi:hypothetical protein